MKDSGQEILKQASGVLLVKYWRLKYFKNGRANMHVERGYHVEIVDAIGASRYWIRSKKDALQYFKQVTAA